MSEKRKLVLVPVNFTEQSENGAVYALQIAAGIDADIVLLNAYLTPVIFMPGMLEPYSYMGNFDSNIREFEKETVLNLEAMKQMLESRIKKEKIDNVNVRYDLINGYPTDSILAYANEYNPSVIVMGSLGKKSSGLTSFGRVTNKVLEKANVPVISVPLGYDAYKFIKPKKVIYITNLDNTDYFALERLCGFAKFFNVKIICIHTSVVESDEIEEAKMRNLKEYVVKQLGVANLECGILELADPQEGLEEFIKKRGADMLAFSAHKRNLLLKFFDASPIHKFIYQTNIPLLVYHAK